MIYFSSRKVSCSRGGGIATNRIDLYHKMKDLIPLYEGFLTYGGMSVREIEAMAVGLRETTDEVMCGQSPAFAFPSDVFGGPHEMALYQSGTCRGLEIHR